MLVYSLCTEIVNYSKNVWYGILQLFILTTSVPSFIISEAANHQGHKTTSGSPILYQTQLLATLLCNSRTRFSCWKMTADGVWTGCFGSAATRGSSIPRVLLAEMAHAGTHPLHQQTPRLPFSPSNCARYRAPELAQRPAEIRKLIYI